MKAPRWLRWVRNALAYHGPMVLKVEAARRVPRLSGITLRPLYAGLNITDNCNMRCIMCGSWRDRSKDELTTAEWKAALRQLRDERVRYVGFAGGEPLLRGDLAELVADASSLGLHTELTTSGYLLDDARLESLLRAGLQATVISIDGVGPAYEAIRGRPWDRVERAVELLGAAHRAGRLHAVIGFVVMKPTLDQVDEVVALAERVGLPLVFSLLDASTYLFQLEENRTSFWISDEADRRRLAAVQRRLAEAKARGGPVADDFTTLEWFSKYFADPRQPALPCAVSQTRILIDSHGLVFGGCWAMGGYGSLRDQPLGEIIRSAAYRQAHRKMFAKECPGCSCGFKVSLTLSLPTRWRELRLRASEPLRRRVFAGGDRG